LLIPFRQMSKIKITVNQFSYLLIFLIGITSSTIFAQSSSIDITTIIGFNGVFTLNTWTPVTIIITNDGKQFKGELQVISTSGNEYQKNINESKYRQHIEIAPKSKKVFSKTILISTYAHPLKIKLFNRGTLISSKSINLRPFYTDKQLFLILANHLPNDIIKNPALNLETKITHSRYLPESWYGYDAVRYVYLHPDFLRLLTNRQFQALKKWVNSGGQLIISGSYNQGALVSNRMRHLIKIDFQGVLKKNTLNALTKFVGVRNIKGSTFLLLNHRVNQSEIILKDDDIPLIQRKQFGLGDIIYVSLDLQENPFRKWKDKYKLWEKLTKLFPTPVDLKQFSDKAIISNMLFAAETNYPSGWPVFMYLFSFVLIMTFLIKKINQNKKGRTKAFKLFTGILLIYISSGFLIYTYFIKTNSFSYNTFTRLFLFGNRQFAMVEQLSGFYSLDKSERQFEMNGGLHPIVIIPHERKRSDITFDLNITEDKKNQIIKLDLNKWSHKFYKSKAVIKMPIQADVESTADRLSIKITNPTLYNIKECYLFLNKRFIKIPDISKKKSTRIAFSPKALSTKAAYIPLESKMITKDTHKTNKITQKNTRAKFLSEELFLSIYHQYKTSENQIHFFGWIEEKVLGSKLMGESVNFDEATFLEWTIPTT